ncbi:MAG: RelA/SpoT family protein, partial [Actinobacteria bacterium]|nr:RelA/SpoT family protein [Actinomycetota bacterium]
MSEEVITPPSGDLEPIEPEVPTELSVGSESAADRRLRSRFARLAPGRRVAHPELEPVLRTLRQFHPKADTDIVERAYEVAAYHHRDQRRRSGEAYITHPLAVAGILADLGMTSPTLAAALLHDTVEDTEYSIEILLADFGEEIARLVDGVTKLDRVKYGQTTASETVRKMVVAMARDIRVLVIKLADRLHNMRTIRWMSPEQQEKKARETLEIFAPLAHRLGMNTIKWELEDLAFATLYPKMYDEIVRMVGQRAPERDVYLQEVVGIVDADMRGSRIKGSVTGRPKHYYSVYQKMIVRGRDLSDIYDLVGVRILVESIRDCYAVLGILHARWNPMPGRFKDYIAMPKFTMYQSLHTTVIGPQGKPVEVQIRTNEMHRAAEYGVAAHWRYKQTSVGGKVGPDDLGWLRQLMEWQRETEDPDEFLESLRYDLAEQETFVFTPKGDVVALPAGSTPVDFAYSVHTEVGHHCVGARVNGKLVALESTLSNGDVVEIFTTKSENAGPSRDWLLFVRSGRARSKIKAWFSKERRDESVEHGKDAIIRPVRKQGLPLHRLINTQSMSAVAHELRLNDVTSLYAAVGENRISAATVVERLVASHGGAEGTLEDFAEAASPSRVSGKTRNQGDPGVVIKGVDDVWVKLARCCTPVPGDEILGFVTRGQGVSVHRVACSNVTSL